MIGGQEVRLEHRNQRVVFAAGSDGMQMCVLDATSGDECDAGDELDCYGHDMIADVVGDEPIDSPGIYVWEGQLKSSGETTRGADGAVRPIMLWDGRVRRALPEELLEINGDLVESPYAEQVEQP